MRRRKSKIYVIDGVELEMYTIGEIAFRLDRQLQTIRKWEKDGTIPPATYRNGSNRRLYSKRQVESIVRTARKYQLKQGHKIPDEFKEEVHEAFAKATEADFA